MTQPPSSPVTDGIAGLRQRAVSGTLWFGGSRIVTQVATWVITIEVVRLLSPADYGLFGYAILVAAFIDLIAELGLGAAVVHRRDLDETDLETVFWLSIAMALGAYALTWVGAPMVAAFFDQPMLVGVLRMSMLTFIISSIRVIPWNLLTKRVDFKHRSIAEMIATILGSLTTLMMAFAGYGVWALVTGLIVRHTALTIACLAMEPWRPRGRFSRVSVRKVLGFGIRTSGGRVAWYLYSKADYLVVGKLLGQQSLGYYTLVFEFASMPVDRISTIINQVAFPVYAALQDRAEPFKRMFLAATTVISIATFPLMAGLASVADVAVPVLLTPKWAPITLPLQIMCVMGAVVSISSLISPAVVAKGYPGLDLRFNLLCLVVLPPGFLVGSRYGLVGVCLAWAILFPVVTAFWFRITRPLIGYTWRELADALAPGVVSAAAMTVVLLMLRLAMHGMAPSAWMLVTLIATGGATYGAALYLGFRERVLDIVQEIRSAA